MFALETMSKAKLTEVAVLSQKNRSPGDNPGVALAFSMVVPNGHLSMFDGSLRSFLYTKSEASSDKEQTSLDVDVEELPNLTTAGEKLGRLHWDQELTGYSLVIDYGMGDKSNLPINDCILSGFTFQPKEGGSVVMDFKLESQDVSEKVFGKLATLKNLEVQITLAEPEVDEGPIQ